MDFRDAANFALDHETARQISEQRAALKQNPDWAEGHYQLAQLLRVQQNREEAKLHLLTALEKKPTLAAAHIALGELYIAENDLDRARQHANFAAQLGDSRLLDQLQRHNAL